SLVTLLYTIGFVGGFVTPTRLDGPPQGAVAAALAGGPGVVGVFAPPPSGVGRAPVQRGAGRVVPPAPGRSTYVLLSSLALMLLFWFWQPVGGVVWSTGDTAGRAVLSAVFGAGWLVVLAATFLINHFDLFGLRQVWLYFRGRPYTRLRFTTP